MLYQKIGRCFTGKLVDHMIYREIGKCFTWKLVDALPGIWLMLYREFFFDSLPRNGFDALPENG